MGQPKRCWRVLASRPQRQNRGWCQRLTSVGYDVLDLPMLEIVPVTCSVQRQAVKAKILTIDDYHAMIFVSQNAVEYAFDWMEDYWPQLPDNMTCYAIGAKTCEYINRRCMAMGYGQPAVPNGQWMNSEALLQHHALQEVKHKKIVIFRGVGGRSAIGDQLQARGAQVDYCELYQRQCPADAASEFKCIKWQLERDILTVFSGETLDNLAQLMSATSSGLLFQLPLLVPGKRVAHMAESLGFVNVITAYNATEPSMLEALQAYCL